MGRRLCYLDEKHICNLFLTFVLRYIRSAMEGGVNWGGRMFGLYIVLLKPLHQTSIHYQVVSNKLLCSPGGCTINP